MNPDENRMWVWLDADIAGQMDNEEMAYKSVVDLTWTREIIEVLLAALYEDYPAHQLIASRSLQRRAIRKQ